MRITAICAALPIALLAGCGAEKNDPEPAPTRTASERAGEPTGNSDQCQLAVLAWKRAARADLVAAVYEVAFDDPKARDVPTDEIKVYCSADLDRAVAEANYELALLNAGLTICETRPDNCDPPKNETQRAKATTLVDKISSLIGAN